MTTHAEVRGGVWVFDPVAVGQREFDAWVCYYRHDWARFLKASVGLVHAGFGMSRRATLTGAWLVLRANQVWAPYPDNDPDAAREFMRRFYDLVVADGQLHADAGEAARLEVEWWRVHRVHQRAEGVTEDDLISAVSALYDYVYDLDEGAAEPAARARVLAMRYSDEWVAAGCALDSTVLADERRALVSSHTALREAVDRNRSSRTQA